MNIKELAVQIVDSRPVCRSCREHSEGWCDTPEGKLLYSPKNAVFGGICTNGHMNEFYLAEAKAGHYEPHDITERTIGKYVPQAECGHGKKDRVRVPEGVEHQGKPVSGTVTYCGLCGMKV